MGTVSVSGTNITVFGDVAGATAYHRASITGAPFIALGSTAKSQTLVSATRFVTAIGACDPETGEEIVPLDDDSTLPENLINGVYELALGITNDPDLISNGGTGGVNTKRLKAGSAELEFFQPVVQQLANTPALRLLLPYLSISKAASSGGVGSALGNEAFGTRTEQPFEDGKAPQLTEGFY